MTARRPLLRLVLAAAVAVGVAWAVLHRENFDPQVLDGWLAGLGLWAPAVHVAAFALGAVFFLPGSLFSLAGGALFGPVWGTLLNLAGATLGAAFAFAIARFLAGDWVARRVGGRTKQLIGGVEDEGWRFVAFVRLVPLFPFNLTNYALGLTRIGLFPYVATSFLCMVPGAAAYAWLGHSGREALEGDLSAIRYGLAGLAMLAAVAFLPRLIRRLRRPAFAWWEPEDLLRRNDGVQVTILDVRGADEFSGPAGHIPGAFNIPLGELPGKLDLLLRPGAGEIVLVCLTDKRSAAAAKILCAAGWSAIAVLRGGMKRWRELGLATA